MFSEYRFVEVSNSMTFRPPQIHSLFFPASDFEKNSKFSKPNHFYVVSNRVEVKRIFRFYRNMDEDMLRELNNAGTLFYYKKCDKNNLGLIILEEAGFLYINEDKKEIFFPSQREYFMYKSMLKE